MKRIFRWILPRLWKDRAGGVFVYVAIAAPVLIGLAGASVDVGLWYANKRLAQSAADSAAMAAGLESLRSDGDADDIEDAAEFDAANHGYSAANGDTIDVTPLAGSQVRVTITRPIAGLLSQVVFTDQTDIQATAVARAVPNNSCVWSLNPTEPQAINVVGAADVNLGCGMIANTSDPDGIHKEGSGCLSASEYMVTGGYDDTNNSGCVLSPVPDTNMPPVDDPLASLPAPSYSSSPCFGEGGGPNPNKISSGDHTFSPGVYCKNISITTNGTVTFLPGLYVLDGVGFKIGAQATVAGAGVSFYSSPAAGVADGIDISGGATVTLSASTTAPLPGILFYQDRATTADITHKFSGGSTMQLDGIIYTPSTDVEFAGGTSADSSSVVIIADEVEFKGGDTFLGDFDTSSILNNPLLIRPQLLE